MSYLLLTAILCLLLPFIPEAAARDALTTENIKAKVTQAKAAVERAAKQGEAKAVEAKAAVQDSAMRAIQHLYLLLAGSAQAPAQTKDGAMDSQGKPVVIVLDSDSTGTPDTITLSEEDDDNESLSQQEECESPEQEEEPASDNFDLSTEEMLLKLEY